MSVAQGHLTSIFVGLCMATIPMIILVFAHFLSDNERITRKKLILSGILKNQVAHIVKCFSNWIELRPYEEQEGWYLLCGEL